MTAGDAVTVETARGPVSLRRTGAGGPPVVLLHPLALSGEVWAPLADHLADRFTVLALDARGHGGSTWDGSPFTVEDMADDAAALIESLGVGPVGVLGMSMGGSTAVALAERHPHLVGPLVLADATSCYGEGREQTWEDRAQSVLATTRDTLIPFQVDRWFSEPFRTEHADDVQRVVDIFLATDSAAHVAACRALGAYDGTAELGSITADTLVLVGDEDYATPPAMSEELAAGIPQARLEILLRTRHMSLIERPDVWPQLAQHFARTEG